MAYEIDGNGNVLIHTFKVVAYCEGDLFGETSKKFSDYVIGWDWARQIERDMNDNDPGYGTDSAYDIKIDVDSEWMSDEAWYDYMESENEY